MIKTKKIFFTLFPALELILIALIPLMFMLSDIIELHSLLFFIIELLYVIILFLCTIINVALCISLITGIIKNEDKRSPIIVVLLTILIILFSVLVMPYIYYKYILKKPMKVVSLILYLISIVFLAFVFVFGYRTYNKMVIEKEKAHQKEENKRITINENNNLFAFAFKMGYEKSNVGEYDLYVKNEEKNVVFTEFTYDTNLYEQKTLEDYLLKGVSDIETTKKNAKVYKEKELKELEDRKAYSIIYEGKTKDASTCIYRITVIQFNSNPNYMLYTVIVTLKDDYEKLSPELDDIINSAKIIQNN
ncbi:MAG: hypothetical protein IKZ96_01030 [Bacilli bacterium]|nr:hypothetical protein [Bacilli bacterium]